MDEMRRGAGGSHGGGDLAGNVAALTHAAYDDAAFDARNAFHSAGEFFIQRIRKRFQAFDLLF